MHTTYKFSESLANAIFESKTEAILIISIEGKLLKYNNFCKELWSMPSTLEEENSEKILELILAQLENPLDFKEIVSDIWKKITFKDARVFNLYATAIYRDNKLSEYLINLRDISEQEKIKIFNTKKSEILTMIASGVFAPIIYDSIALLYESKHPGLRCSLLELKDGVLLHGGAPSMPKEYCEAVHGLKSGPSVGSCGTSTYHGYRVIVEDISTDKKWEKIKHLALPHGLRSCWSEPIINSEGKVLGAFGMYYNHPAKPNDKDSQDLKSAARLAGIVMERDRAQSRIRELAYTDKLTGLANRASFHEKLKSTIRLSKRDNKTFGLLSIDLDDFKSVNDTLGHDIGDSLLCELAKRLTKICAKDNYLVRLGGDEFSVIVKEIEGDSYIAMLAQNCLEAVSRPVDLGGRIFTPSCSIGVACFPNDADEFMSIRKVVDTALYFAKEQGKNQYAFYQPELTKKVEYRFRMEQDLREAIEKEQLSLVYQPQINIRTEKLIGFEALARWNHDKLGFISPIDFIPIIEKIGMMKQFTNWVLTKACKQAVSWKKLVPSSFTISVNVSPTSFLDKEIVRHVKKVIKETGILAHELKLEVTENIVQIDLSNLLIFQELKEIGILIAIDDFGTGYSSLASLKHFEIDDLKIDKYFIDEMLLDSKGEYLVRSIIELGAIMSYTVIAEGVETQEQLSLLKKLNCEAVQGYIYSKPMHVDEVQEYLTV